VQNVSTINSKCRGDLDGERRSSNTLIWKLKTVGRKVLIVCLSRSRHYLSLLQSVTLPTSLIDLYNRSTDYVFERFIKYINLF